jgi:predicted nucleic acid-binding protein
VVESRASELVSAGLRPLDALHVAFAERAQARWFVTCDDDVLRMAARLGGALRTLVVAPETVIRTDAP